MKGLVAIKLLLLPSAGQTLFNFLNPHTNVNTPISTRDQFYAIFPRDWSICRKSASLSLHLLLSYLSPTRFSLLLHFFPSVHFSANTNKWTWPKLPACQSLKHTYLPLKHVCCHVQVLVLSLFYLLRRDCEMPVLCSYFDCLWNVWFPLAEAATFALCVLETSLSLPMPNTQVLCYCLCVVLNGYLDLVIKKADALGSAAQEL